MDLGQFRVDLEAALKGQPLAVQVALINEARSVIHGLSPFRNEPVEFVEWVPIDVVVANDYNPNSVAPPEMALLELSVLADGFTQPIVTNQENGHRVVIDGFHRNRVGREAGDVADRLQGFLPDVQIQSHRADRNDRIAATIRHNRARGKHQVEAMSDIVVELKRRNWSYNRIGKELGMDPDEVLRLTQISGLTEMFGDRDFSEAWEHYGGPEAAVYTEDGEEVDLEWMDGPSEYETGWVDRTDRYSILTGEDGSRQGVTQRSRFKESEWFWYAYTVPHTSGAAATRAEAKHAIETAVS